MSDMKTSLGIRRSKDNRNLVSFDHYFFVLLKKNRKIKAHHKMPLKIFLSNFGNTKAQTAKWFDAHVEKYLA